MDCSFKYYIYMYILLFYKNNRHNIYIYGVFVCLVRNNFCQIFLKIHPKIASIFFFATSFCSHWQKKTKHTHSKYSNFVLVLGGEPLFIYFRAYTKIKVNNFVLVRIFVCMCVCSVVAMSTLFFLFVLMTSKYKAMANMKLRRMM